MTETYTRINRLLISAKKSNCTRTVYGIKSILMTDLWQVYFCGPSHLIFTELNCLVFYWSLLDSSQLEVSLQCQTNTVYIIPGTCKKGCFWGSSPCPFAPSCSKCLLRRHTQSSLSDHSLGFWHTDTKHIGYHMILCNLTFPTMLLASCC